MASQPPPRTVTLWDDAVTGHHPRYFDAVLSRRPAHVERTFVPAPFAARVQAPGIEHRSTLDAALRESQACVLLDLQAALRRHQRVLRRSNVRLGGVDLWSPKTPTSAKEMVKEQVEMRRRLAFSRRGARTGALAYEAAGLGVARLPDLIERFPLPPEEGPRRDSEKLRLLVPGEQSPRKGLDLLVESLVAIVRERPAVRSRFRLCIVGVFGVRHAQWGRAVLRRAEGAGLEVELATARPSPDDFSRSYAAADVLVLPYRAARGGSGFLGSAIDFPQLRGVVSDHGWLGRVARGVGALTFRDGDVDSLGDALVKLLDEPPRGVLSPPAFPLYYAEAADFGDAVWNLLPA
jgi:glycosyltransferase involved in cell wall biosynthesis